MICPELCGGGLRTSETCFASRNPNRDRKCPAVQALRAKAESIRTTELEKTMARVADSLSKKVHTHLRTVYPALFLSVSSLGPPSMPSSSPSLVTSPRSNSTQEPFAECCAAPAPRSARLWRSAPSPSSTSCYTAAWLPFAATAPTPRCASLLPPLLCPAPFTWC